MIKKELPVCYPTDRIGTACVIVGLDATIMYIFNEFSTDAYCSNNAFIEIYVSSGEYMTPVYRFDHD